MANNRELSQFGSLVEVSNEATSIKVGLADANVGLGTTNPTERLEVHGNIKVVGGSINVGSAGTFTEETQFNAGVGIADSIFHVGDVDTQIRFPAADIVSVETAGSERFRVESGGGIGIGDSIYHLGDTNTQVRFPAADTFTVETAGSERFRVGSNGYVSVGKGAQGDELLHVGSASSLSPAIKVENDQGSLIIGRRQTSRFGIGTEGHVIQSVGDDFAIGTSDGEDFTIGTNNEKRITVKSGGRVGIGTDDPDELLEVLGKAKVIDLDASNISVASGVGTFQTLKVTGDLTVDGTTTTLDTTLIDVDRIEVGANSNSIVAVAVTQSGKADILKLFNGAGTEVLGITTDGNITIAGDITANGNIQGDGSTNISSINDITAGGVLTVDGVSDLDELTVAGVSTFSSNLDVNASVDVSTDLTVDGITDLDELKVAGVSTFSDTVEIPSDSKKILLGAEKEMQVFHDGTDSLIKDTRNSGSVKIQADNFSVIDKDASETMLSAAVDGAVELNHNGSTRFKTTGLGVTVYGNLGVRTDLTVYGKVGINEPSPDTPVHIKNNAAAGIRAALKLENSGTNNTANDTMGEILFAHNDSNDVGVAASIVCKAEDAAGNTYLQFNNGKPSASIEALRITSAGLVGINSASPTTALDIQSTKNGDGLTITKAGTRSAFLGHNGSGNEGLLILRESGTNKIQLYAESGQPSFINSGNLGIGTNSPNFSSFGSNTGGLEISDVNTNNALLVQSGANEFYFANTSSTNYIWGDDDAAIVFGTNDTEKLRIKSDGLVGIGTNSPTEILHLHGATTKSLLRFTSGSYGVSNSDGSHIGINFGGLELWHKESNYLRFGTNNTERLRITSTGKILSGIATARDNLANNASGVEAQVQIEGSSFTSSTLSIIRNSDNADDGGIILGKTRSPNTFGNAAVQAGDDLGDLIFAGSDGTSLQFGAEILAEVQSGVGNDDLPTDLIFKTNGGTTNTTERVRIKSDGKIGIGITNPDGLLTIKGNSDEVTTPSIRLLDGTDSREVSITNTSGDFIVSTHGTDDAIHGRIKIFESGVIDIDNGGSSGTLTNRLRIRSTGWQESHAAYAAVGVNTFASWARTGGAIRAEIGYNAETTDYMYFGTGTNHPVALRVNNDTALYIKNDASRSVGIGTDNPAAKLHLNDDSGPLVINRNLDAVNQISFRTVNVHRGSIGANSAACFTAYNSSSAEKLRITDGGNVGINSNSPTSYGNSQTTLVISDTTNPALCINDGGQSKDWWLVGLSDGLGVRYADGGGGGSASNVTSAAFFKNNGKTGFGENSPLVTLHVGGTDAIRVPSGTTAQRPSGAVGYIRYNSDIGSYEGHNGSEWAGIGGAAEVETSVSSTATTTCESFAKATYRSATIVAQITQGSSYQVGNYLLIHDGTTATLVEESAVATGDMLGSFTATISGSNVVFQVNMASATAATVTTKMTKVSIP